MATIANCLIVRGNIHAQVQAAKSGRLADKRMVINSPQDLPPGHTPSDRP